MTVERTMSLGAIVASIYEEGRTTRELAEAAMAAADDATNREAALRGWQDICRVHTRQQWQHPTVRSGHDNRSGRFAGIALLQRTIRLNDGSAYLVGEVTEEVAEQLAAEYAARAREEAAGQAFWSWAMQAMRDLGVPTVADLGEERVEAAREETGYRG